MFAILIRGTTEWQNGGTAENNPKSYKTERRKITENPERRNGGKLPQILKGGIK